MKTLRPLILSESRSIHYSKLVKDDISYLFQSDGTIHAVSLYADNVGETATDKGHDYYLGITE